jgi:hypothetical protein
MRIVDIWIEKRSHRIGHNSGDEYPTFVIPVHTIFRAPAMGAGAAGASEHRLRVRRRFEVFKMHMVIYALVEASTHDDALATGKMVFDRLVGADPHATGVFDYYVTFDENDTTVAGKARGETFRLQPQSTPMTARPCSTVAGRRRKKSSSAISTG